MPIQLNIFITICIIAFIYYVLLQVKKSNISLKNSLIWIAMGFFIILSLFNIGTLSKIAEIIGVEKISNMIFFFGFMFLIFVCFYLSINISKQNKKIITLVQRLAITENELKSKNEK